MHTERYIIIIIWYMRRSLLNIFFTLFAHQMDERMEEFFAMVIKIPLAYWHTARMIVRITIENASGMAVEC